MKILCLYKSGGEEFRLRGFGNALMSAGHNFFFWDSSRIPAYDVFDEYEPDIFIGTTFDLDNQTIRCIKERPLMKVILKGSNYGPSNRNIDPNKYPIVMAKSDEIKTIQKLKEETGKPDFVFCHYHPNRLEETMSGWDEIGVKSVALMNAADVIEYPQGTFRKELESDISFIGGYWPYKSENLDKYLTPLCAEVGKYNIKVWGNQAWYIPQYLGITQNSLVKDIYASARICPNISEPHSLAFGFDIVERPFKIMSAGGFCLMDRVDSAVKDVFTESGLCEWYDKDNFEQRILKWLPEEKNRKEIAKRGQEFVYANHTYHHRTYDMLVALGMEKEAKEIMSNYYVYYYKGLNDELAV
jgi:spore maturation protein CgeB